MLQQLKFYLTLPINHSLSSFKMPETRGRPQTRKSPAKKKTPKKKPPAKPKKPTAAQQMDEFRTFMIQQADVNRTLLETIQGINKDKLVELGASGVGEGQPKAGPGKSGKSQAKMRRIQEIDVLSTTEISGSESDSEE